MMFILALLALFNFAVAFQVQNARVASRSMVMMAEKSKSLPFMPRPANLNGLVGDVGKKPCFLHP
jgi:hypothetical protein